MTLVFSQKHHIKIISQHLKSSLLIENNHLRSKNTKYSSTHPVTLRGAAHPRMVLTPRSRMAAHPLHINTYASYIMSRRIRRIGTVVWQTVGSSKRRLRFIRRNHALVFARTRYKESGTYHPPGQMPLPLEPRI